MDELSLTIKKVLEKDPQEDIDLQLEKVKRKISAILMVRPQYLDTLERIQESIDKIHQKLNTADSKSDKFIKNTNSKETTAKKLDTLLVRLGLSPYSPELIHLLISLYTTTVYLDEYQHIKENPLELSAFLKRVPEGSYYINENNSTMLVYEKNKIAAAAVVPTLGILDVFSSISNESVIEFYRFICNTPLLGLHHEVGRHIFQSIQNMDISHFKKKKTGFLYRGRIRDIETRPFTEKEMFEPPFGFPGHGRGNMNGIPALYFSDNKDTVVNETNWQENDNPLDVIEVKVNRNFTFLDLTDKTCPFLSYCYFPHTKSNDFSSYIIPNFLADCCRLKGIDGMVYRSTKNEKAKNYVFFDSNKQWFKDLSFLTWKGYWDF